MAYLHFDSIAHRANKKDGGTRRTLVYRRTRSARPVKCRGIRFTGTGELVYAPNRPLRCGAVAWVEVNGPVELVDPEPISVRTAKV